jgi:DNA-binding transcriptional LysR family regulator
MKHAMLHLKGFEAVARRQLSVSRAAEELHLT